MLVYVPQDDIRSGSPWIREGYRRCYFLIKTQSILAEGFHIGEREISPHNYDAWMADVDGLTLVIDVYRRVGVLRGTGSPTYGALLFVNVESKDRFLLTLEADDHYNVGVNIIIGLIGKSPLKSMLNTFYEEQPFDEKYLRRDRVSKFWFVGISGHGEEGSGADDTLCGRSHNWPVVTSLSNVSKISLATLH
jgi:hypothetical protein